jgi:ComF family protein
MKGWIEALVDLVYPPPDPPDDLRRVEAPMCVRCGEPFSAAADAVIRCSNCAGRRWWLEQARAAYRAEGGVRECIHEFKYHRQFHHLRLLAGWLEEGFDRFYAAEAWDGLVPVPLHPARRAERGFNQAEELARQLSRASGIPVCRGLKRVRRTETQTRLRRSERIRNQEQAFALKRGFDAAGRRLLIVDDVFTTGATVNACARILAQAGAARVCALTVARG